MTTDLAVRRDDPDDLFRIAKAFAASGYFKDSRDEAQCVVRILAGRELGFGAFASMSGIHIIEGKPAVSAGLMATAIENSGRYAYHLAWEPNDRDVTGCAITFYRLHMGGKGGRTELGVSRFSIEDARAAGLWDRAMWKKYTRNMLFSRAMSNGCRWYCAGVFGVGAVYTPEELGADVDADGAPVAAPAPVIRMVASEPRAVPTFVGTDRPHSLRDAAEEGSRRDVSPREPEDPSPMPPAMPRNMPTRERSREVPEGKRWSEAALAWFWASLGDLRPRVTGDEVHAILGVESLHDWGDLDDALARVRAARGTPFGSADPTGTPIRAARVLSKGDRIDALAAFDAPPPADTDDDAPPLQGPTDDPSQDRLLHPEGSVEWEWERYAALVQRVARWNGEYPEQRISAAEPPRGATAPQVRAYADGLERRLAKLGVEGGGGQ